jgi:hypothetical protein
MHQGQQSSIWFHFRLSRAAIGIESFHPDADVVICHWYATVSSANRISICNRIRLRGHKSVRHSMLRSECLIYSNWNSSCVILAISVRSSGTQRLLTTCSRQDVFEWYGDSPSSGKHVIFVHPPRGNTGEICRSPREWESLLKVSQKDKFEFDPKYSFR